MEWVGGYWFKDARRNARARLEQRFGDQNVVQILQNWFKICPKFVENWPKMRSGAALGASGSQKTTREAPKTIFASKMGGPGLQKGAKMEAKMLLEIDQKNDAENIRFWDPKCLQNGGQMVPKWG